MISPSQRRLMPGQPTFVDPCINARDWPVSDPPLLVDPQGTYTLDK